MQAITTKYLGATDTRGSRIKATSESGESITIPYPYDAKQGVEAHSLAAIALCRKLGWRGELIGGAIKDAYVFVFAGPHAETFPIGLSEDEAWAIQSRRNEAILART